MLRVEIRIKGHLDKKWAEWLAGFTLKPTGHDETALEGRVEDQAALYGLIGKLRDLGVKLATVHVGEEREDFLEKQARLELTQGHPSGIKTMREKGADET